MSRSEKLAAKGYSGTMPRGVQQVVAWIGIAVLVVLMSVATSLAPVSSGAVDLGGTWQGRAADGSFVGPLQVPGLFGRQGLKPDARIAMSRSVDLPDDGVLRSLWVESPQYSVRVSWDGAVIDEVGSVDKPGGGRDVAVLVDLPASPGTHKLTLDLDGKAGEGGVVGRVLLGPREAIRTVWARTIAEQAGLSLMLAMLGVLHLGVATRAPRRDVYLLFGLFACSMAVWTFCQSDVSAFVLPDLDTQIRLRRVSHALLPGLGAAFVSAFLYGRVTWPPWAFIAIGFIASALVPFLPFGLLYRIEQLVDLITVPTLAWFAFVTIESVVRRARWSYLLLLTTAPPLIVGSLSNILISHGVVGGGSFLFPGFAWFMGGCAVALAVRHADEAERHERLVSGAGDVIMTLDRAGMIRDINPAGRAMLGDALDHPLIGWVRPEDHALARLHLVRGPQAIDRAELRIVLGPRRELIVDSNATALEDGSRLIVLRDVTLRRKADESLLRAARMEMMGALASGVAHDFNNMLGTLLAQVGFLQSGPDGKSSTDTLHRMERTIERSSVLIKRLLTAVGGTSSELERVDVGALCRDAADLVRPMLPRAVKLVVDVPAESFFAIAAAGDLEQVLVNLLVNARDAVAARPSGTIVVRVGRWRLGAVTGVGVMVEDDGTGVPESMRREIFEPFVTTKAPGKGTGLGLAVAARVLRDCDGRIWVEERPGGGARFFLALRSVQPDRDATGDLPQGRRVLLVEDEDALRETFARTLTDAGYVVQAVSGGAAAISALREHPPDVLVTDVVMPDVSGLAVAEACQVTYPDVPILLVSGFVPDEALVALQRWSWHRLDKPVRGSRLVSTVGRIRRRAERRARGEVEITDISQALPPLDSLTSAAFESAPETPA